MRSRKPRGRIKPLNSFREIFRFCILRRLLRIGASMDEFTSVETADGSPILWFYVRRAKP